MQNPVDPNDPADQGVKTYERGFPVGYVSAFEVSNDATVSGCLVWDAVVNHVGQRYR